MKKLTCYAAFHLFLVLATLNSWSQFPDPSFGNGGKVGPFNNGFFPAAWSEKIQSVQSMTIDNLGRIWIAGHKSNGTNMDFAVMRLNSDGTPDAGFGDNGVQKFSDLTGNGNSDEYATVIAFRAPENTCILAGYRVRTDNSGSNSDIVVMQLNADGSVDNNFGLQGVRIIDAAIYEEVYSIAFSSGSGTNGIFLGGFTNPGFVDFNPGRGRIYRMNNTGGSVSSIEVDYAGAPCHVYSLDIDANGNILAGGDNSGGPSRLAIARFLPNLTPDNSFDGDGKAFVDVGNTPFGISQIRLQGNGKILLASSFFDLNTNSEGTVVARLNNDGSVDNSFSGGYRVVPFNYTLRIASPRSMALLADGRILVSGLANSTSAADTDFGLARLNSDGTIDNSFGNNGMYSFDFGNGSNDVNNTLLLQDDGKLLAGAMARSANSDRFGAGLLRIQFTAPVQCSIDGPDQLCSGGRVSYSAAQTFQSYKWTIAGNGSFVEGTATDGPTVEVRAGNGTGSFTLSLAAVDANGAGASCTKTVSVTQASCAISGPATVCSNTPTVFEGPANMAAYHWSITGNGTIQGSNTGQSVTVSSAGGSYTLSLSATGGCTYRCEKEVTASAASPCSVTGPSPVNPWTTGNTYSGPSGMTSYNWTITGNGTITGSNTGQSVKVTSGSPGTYTLTLTTTFNGCTSNPCSLMVIVNPTVSACTYTQDFYSRRNNKGCSSGSTVSVTQLMLNAFGASDSKIFGSGATYRFFTLYRSDINNGNIFRMLPGFDGSSPILEDNTPPLMGASYDDKTTWPLVPIPANGMQKGKIGNQLLAQVITLWFNLGNNKFLGTISLANNVLTTNAQIDCGNTAPVGTPQSFKVHPDIVAFLNSQNVYTRDVNGLFQLANDRLGGLVAHLPATDIKDAVEAINNAFADCRVLTGTSSSTKDAPVTRVSQNAVQEPTGALTLSVTAFPNPYYRKFNLRITTPVSGLATIEFYTMNGARIYEIKRQVTADIDNLVPYTGPYHSGSLLYRVRMGSYKASGFVVHPD